MSTSIQKRTKLMTAQIGIKIEPHILNQIKKFAQSHGTSVSALMRQATMEYINKRITSVDTECQLDEFKNKNESEV